jgi:hypothetical protein
VVEISKLPEMLLHILSRLCPLLSLDDCGGIVPFSLLQTYSDDIISHPKLLLEPTSTKQKARYQKQADYLVDYSKRLPSITYQ